MKFSTEKPPNWETLEKKFGVKWGAVAVTYGDTVYARDPIRDDLKAHEAIHVGQQLEYPGGIEAWWKRYLEDPAFRVEQEIEAYREQLKFVRRHVPDRNKAFRIHDQLARDLSGPTYGHAIPYQTAFFRIGSAK